MKSISRSISCPAGMLAVVALILASTAVMSGQEPQAGKTKGVPWDWTHHHVVYSHPRGVAAGNEAAQKRLAADPRYIMHQQQQGAKAAQTALNASTRGLTDASRGSSFGPEADLEKIGREANRANRVNQPGMRTLPSGIIPALIPPPGGPTQGNEGSMPAVHRRIHKDWSENLGPAATAGGTGATTGLGEFPATFTTGTSCTDYAIYNTGLAGSASEATIVAYDNLYTACNSGTPTAYWAYNTGTLGGTSGTTTNSVILSSDGTQAAFVQFVPYATAATGTLTASTGVVPTANTTITIGSTTYTWVATASITTVGQLSTSGITLETQISQTLYAALTGSRANCPSSNTTCISASQTANSAVTAAVSGEVVTVSAGCGVGTCGNGVALSQSGATGMAISPATGGLSGGSGTAGVGGAQLVILKWAPGGSISAPVTLTSNASYPNCTAPCMIALPLSGTPTDTYSAPFVAYGAQGGPSTIYVGDDTGKLHQFANVFTAATPSEAIGGGWPATVSANGSLGSPVYDTVSGLVFVGDYASLETSSCELYTATNPCGYLYSVNSSGAVVASEQLDYNIGIFDSPIVDSTAGIVYAFVGDDGTTNCSGGPCAGVFQFPTTYAAAATGSEASVGPGYEFMMSGSFDNAYFTSPNNTGNLYVVGNTGPANNTLYQIPITSGVMGTAVAGPVIATNYTSGYYSAGLQVSEFYNTSAGSFDYLFTSVLGFGQNTANIACPGQTVSIGCVMGFDVTSGVVSANTAATGVLAEVGGTSGIVVDNGAAGASNIYFSTLLNQSCSTASVTNGCAIQTVQSAP